MTFCWAFRLLVYLDSNRLIYLDRLLIVDFDILKSNTSGIEYPEKPKLVNVGWMSWHLFLHKLSLFGMIWLVRENTTLESQEGPSGCRWNIKRS